jgi:hypothetical protein
MDARQGFMSYRDKIGDVPVTIYLAFLDEQFARAAISFEASKFFYLRAAFVEKYGPPTKQSENLIQNRLGAKFQNEELRWVGDRVQIILNKYARQITEGEAVFRTKEWDMYLQQQYEKKTGDAAKDL